MSIGSRLKEERLRLGMSQAAFASLAGASKGAQLKWEKDESAPTATVLVAFAEAGADVLFILTGERRGVRPAAMSDSQASEIVSAAEACLTKVPEWPVPPEFGDRDRLIAELRGVAIDLGVSDKIRASADGLLDVALTDAEANARHVDRETRVRSHFRAVEGGLRSACRAVDFRPPRLVYQSLLSLMFRFGLGREDITDLLLAIQAVAPIEDGESD